MVAETVNEEGGPSKAQEGGSPLFSLRIVNLEHYMARPLPDMDVCYSQFQGRSVEEVPVVRIYGSTPAGQKACLHLHQSFPYFYLPYDEDLPQDINEALGYVRCLASAIEKAMKLASSVGAKKQHLHCCSLVRARKYYGFHLSEQLFIKLVLYHPQEVSRISALLLGGGIMNRKFQPHEAHIPYLLQLLIDQNLSGMSHLHLSSLKFRHPLPEHPSDKANLLKQVKYAFTSQASIPTPVVGEAGSVPEMTLDAKGLTVNDPEKNNERPPLSLPCQAVSRATAVNGLPAMEAATPPLIHERESSSEGGSQPQLWLRPTVPADWLWPSQLISGSSLFAKHSTCELEADASVEDILNRHELLFIPLQQAGSSTRMVQSLMPMWEEECLRSGEDGPAGAAAALHPSAERTPPPPSALEEALRTSLFHVVQEEEGLSPFDVDAAKHGSLLVQQGESCTQQKLLECTQAANDVVHAGGAQGMEVPFDRKNGGLCDRLGAWRHGGGVEALEDAFIRQNGPVELLDEQIVRTQLTQQDQTSQEAEKEVAELLRWMGVSPRDSEMAEGESEDVQGCEGVPLSQVWGSGGMEAAMIQALSEYESASQQECRAILDCVDDCEEEGDLSETPLQERDEAVAAWRGKCVDKDSKSHHGMTRTVDVERGNKHGLGPSFKIPQMDGACDNESEPASSSEGKRLGVNVKEDPSIVRKKGRLNEHGNYMSRVTLAVPSSSTAAASEAAHGRHMPRSQSVWGSLPVSVVPMQTTNERQVSGMDGTVLQAAPGLSSEVEPEMNVGLVRLPKEEAKKAVDIVRSTTVGQQKGASKEKKGSALSLRDLMRKQRKRQPRKTEASPVGENLLTESCGEREQSKSRAVAVMNEVFEFMDHYSEDKGLSKKSVVTLGRVGERHQEPEIQCHKQGGKSPNNARKLPKFSVLPVVQAGGEPATVQVPTGNSLSRMGRKDFDFEVVKELAEVRGPSEPVRVGKHHGLQFELRSGDEVQEQWGFGLLKIGDYRNCGGGRQSFVKISSSLEMEREALVCEQSTQSKGEAAEVDSKAHSKQNGSKEYQDLWLASTLGLCLADTVMSENPNYLKDLDSIETLGKHAQCVGNAPGNQVMGVLTPRQGSGCSTGLHSDAMLPLESTSVMAGASLPMDIKGQFMASEEALGLSNKPEIILEELLAPPEGRSEGSGVQMRYMATATMRHIVTPSTGLGVRLVASEPDIKSESVLKTEGKLLSGENEWPFEACKSESDDSVEVVVSKAIEGMSDMHFTDMSDESQDSFHWGGDGGGHKRDGSQVGPEENSEGESNWSLRPDKEEKPELQDFVPKKQVMVTVEMNTSVMEISQTSARQTPVAAYVSTSTCTVRRIHGAPQPNTQPPDNKTSPSGTSGRVYLATVAEEQPAPLEDIPPQHELSNRVPLMAGDEEGESLVPLRFHQRPPTKAALLESLGSHGLEPVEYGGVFYGNPKDVPERPAIMAGLVFNVKSKEAPDLPPFLFGCESKKSTCSSSTRPRVYMKESWGAAHEADAVEGVPCHFENDGSVSYLLSPVRPPPNASAVRRWLSETQLEASHLQIASVRGDQLFTMDSNTGKLVPLAEIGSSSSSQDGLILKATRDDDAQFLRPASPKYDEKHVLSVASPGYARSPFASPAHSLPTRSLGVVSPKQTANPQLFSNAIARPSTPVNPQSSCEVVFGQHLVNVSPFKLQQSGVVTPHASLQNSLIISEPQASQDPLAHSSHHMMPSTHPTVGHAPCLDISTVPLHNCDREKGPSSVSSGFKQISSMEKPKEEVVIKSALQWRDISQITGPSPVKGQPTPLSQSGFRDPANVGAGQQVTLMSMEVLAETRGDLRPDPRYDAIACVVVVIQYDDEGDGYTNSKTMVLIRDPTAASVSRNIDGVTGCDIIYLPDESTLLKCFVQLVRLCDPDMLVGWEIQGFSLGLLAERAANLGIGLLKQLSRTPPLTRATSNVAEKGACGPQEFRDALFGGKVPVETIGVSDPIIEDEWGRTHGSGIFVGGRIVLNLWRIMRGEVKLGIYTLEAVAEAVLRRRVPQIPWRTLSNWFRGGPAGGRFLCIEYFIDRARLNLQIMDQLDLINRTAELARAFGIDFFSVFSRGSQYRVESMMARLAHTQNFLLLSPSRQQVASQPAMECLPLVMEPESRLYTSPVVVLDFQSLYPSMIIAYNLCFSTCLGKVVPNNPKVLGVTSLTLPPQLLRKLKDCLTITPNGVLFTPPEVCQGVLPRLLQEILSTRIMVKQAMKKLSPQHRVLQRILNARQFALKLIANVTYGYTAAGFSGRMPCAELADSIVQFGRQTLERAIHLVNSHSRWDARVVYGDTDSMFVLLEGRTREDAFKIGQEIAAAVTASNPNPVTLKMEKVYHPCVLLTKKRYVGYSYESPGQLKPTFDAKGIETVRRDSCAAVAKMLERSLRTLFETQDLSQVKQYLQRQWSKILSGRISLRDFIFAKEVRLGTYSARSSVLPPAAIVASKAMAVDPRAEPCYGERVPYVVVHGEPGARLSDMVVSPHIMLERSLRLHETYYITKQIIPALQRVFGLVGADLKLWYAEMPRVYRPPMSKRVSSSFGNLPLQRFGGGMAASESAAKAGSDLGKSGKGAVHKGTIDHYYLSQHCTICGEIMPGSQLICTSCSGNPQAMAAIVAARTAQLEKEFKHLVTLCQHCGGSNGGADGRISCTSLDCPIFFERRKVQKELQASLAIASDFNYCPPCLELF